MSKRDVVIFFAGAFAFHTLSHFLLPYLINLPITIANIEVTTTFNNWTILVNVFITLALLLWAKKLPK